MTREEAILWLKNLRIKDFGWTDDSEETKDIRKQCEDSLFEAIDLAIEALSADVEIPSDKTVVHIETYRRLYEKYVDLKNNAVKVVKCKNCRHRFYDKYNDCYMCDRHEYGESFEDDDFCSWGERREP